jgi:hypothetical protein
MRACDDVLTDQLDLLRLMPLAKEGMPRSVGPVDDPEEVAVLFRAQVAQVRHHTAADRVQAVAVGAQAVEHRPPGLELGLAARLEWLQQWQDGGLTLGRRQRGLAAQLERHHP